MSKTIDFYCWYNCNTCRQAKAYLIKKGYNLNERDFFKERFSREEMAEILTGRQASEMFSSRSPVVKALGVNVESLTQNEMIELMLEEPRLVRRPVVRINGKVYFGTDVKTLEKILETGEK